MFFVFFLSLLLGGAGYYRVGATLHFHLAGSVDPGANIPVHSSRQSSANKKGEEQLLFLVHWMNNKQLCAAYAVEALRLREAERELAAKTNKLTRLSARGSFYVIDGPDSSSDGSRVTPPAIAEEDMPPDSPGGRG